MISIQFHSETSLDKRHIHIFDEEGDFRSPFYDAKDCIDYIIANNLDNLYCYIPRIPSLLKS